MDSLASKAHLPSQTAKIVVAEDEVLWRLTLADVLRNEGFQVFEAADAGEAISIMESTPDVDVVISDMRMRTAQDGLSVARYVRGHFPGISLALASAYFPSPVDATFDAVFVKPFRPQDVVSWIRRRLATTASHSA